MEVDAGEGGGEGEDSTRMTLFVRYDWRNGPTEVGSEAFTALIGGKRCHLSESGPGNRL